MRNIKSVMYWNLYVQFDTMFVVKTASNQFGVSTGVCTVELCTVLKRSV